MTATYSKLEKLSFSGKDEEFAAFSRQFEARMHKLNLGNCLEDKLTVRTCSGLGQGFKQLHPLLQARRGGSLESICGEAPRGPASRRCSLKLAPGEKVTEYLTKAEGIRLDLQEAGEMTSNVIFCAMVLKSLPPTFESIATVLNFGPRKGYEEMTLGFV